MLSDDSPDIGSSYRRLEEGERRRPERGQSAWTCVTHHPFYQLLFHLCLGCALVCAMVASDGDSVRFFGVGWDWRSTCAATLAATGLPQVRTALTRRSDHRTHL